VTDVESDPSDIDAFDDDLEASAPPEDDWEPLPSTRLFDQTAAESFLRRAPATIVAIIGERGSGKTTLVSTIYERFLREPFGGYFFALSRTLTGFEQRLFTSRLASGRTKPATPRTSNNDPLNFFHLAVARESDPSVHINLLLSERAGELYRQVRDNPAKALELPEITKADHIAVVIDGRRLIDPTFAAEAAAETRGLIRALADSSAVPATACVQVVTTKMDLLTGRGKATARAALKELQEALTKSFSARFANFQHFEVTARDPKAKVAVGSGTERLLDLWTAERPRPVPTELRMPTLMTQYDRLRLKPGV
jgi:energy-coupling factor transporter ATP-binding protein EcfA2